MKNFSRCLPLLIAFFAFILMVLPTPSTAQEPADSPMTLHKIDVNGVERHYSLYLPPALTESPDSDAVYPLVVVFHQAGGSGEGIARLTQFNTYAARDNVIIAYPEGPQGYWDYGVGLPQWDVIFDLNDDVAFFDILLETLLADYPIDATRIYAVGFSNGARMAFRVGCEFGNRLSGIVAVAASISDEVTGACPAETRVSVMYMHGTEDTITPWEGEELTDGGRLISHALSAPDTVTFWAAQNQCDSQPVIEDMPDANPDDRVMVRRVTFSGCEGERQVIFYAVLGGGHDWLGGIPNLMPSDYKPSGAATAYSWDFFGLPPITD